MHANGGSLEILRGDGALVLQVGGRWLIGTAAELDRRLSRLDGVSGDTAVRIDLAGIEKLDTVGAWLLLRTYRRLKGRGITVAIENVPRAFAPLLDQVERGEPPESARPPRATLIDIIAGALGFVGEGTVAFLVDARDLVGFFGLVCVSVLRTLREPSRLRAVSLAAQIERAGLTALPIIGLLSFLIGIVVAYQGADQLRRFGAEIFAVNLLGVGILRELGVLMTAIVVAGRSGSAFTAEIGAMQVNEEIDALRTLGLDPIEVLVLPRLFALLLVLPLLTVYADFMALLGGALMSWLVLGIPLTQFILQLHDAVTEPMLLMGPGKALFFGATIAVVGCRRGLGVERSAESVGRLTTLSVVESIFLVIIIDAVFSIIFARLHL